MSIAAIAATAAQPGLPGATNERPNRGDFAAASASACSRAPAPRIKTFILTLHIRPTRDRRRLTRLPYSSGLSKSDDFFKPRLPPPAAAICRSRFDEVIRLAQ